jgi:uncharacterized protein with von Willebrand factor type A (vWA) domain
MAVARPLPEADGRLTENIVHFTRALRKAGVQVGPAQVASAIEAVETAGFTRKTDFYHILRATLINRAEHLELYHQVFTMFWRDPEYLEQMIQMMSPTLRRDDEKPIKKAAERRAAEALTDQPEPPSDAPEREQLEVDAAFTWSANENLRQMDFEQMSVAELAEATRAVGTLNLPVKPLQTRRYQASRTGRSPDLRATLRTSLRRGGDIQHLDMRVAKTRAPDLVALCDISGSMSVYSRVLLHFLHRLAHSPNGNWGKVNAFTFGTKLTNISNAMEKKEPDQALETIGNEADDWQGGTRIGAALERFNKDWSRRVLGRGSVVLLITDGLERGDVETLNAQAERLQLSCRTLIWLNPLLRWNEFEPKAAGIRTLLRHSDQFRACHSLDSLTALSDSLSQGRNSQGIGRPA